jgi:hypothetical protein
MPQNTLIVNALAILNARTRSIGADILSGLDSKIINAPIIIAAYIMEIQSFLMMICHRS